MNKVQDGTPLSGPSMCETCVNCTVAKGYRTSQEVRYCGYFQEFVGFSVQSCSKYHNSARPELTEMRKIAWTIETRNRGTWGFTAGGKEFKPPEREVVVRPPGVGPDEAPE